MAAESKGFDEDFAAQLEELDYYAQGEHVEVEITAVEHHGDAVTVTFDPPVGDAFDRTMEVPHDPAAETEFTKLLRTAGRGYSNAEDVIGDRVPAQYADDGWEIQYDEPERSIQGRIRDGWERRAESLFFGAMAVSALFYWPVMGPFVLIVAELYASEDDDLEGIGLFFGTFTYLLGTGVWYMLNTLLRSALTAMGFPFPIRVVVGL